MSLLGICALLTAFLLQCALVGASEQNSTAFLKRITHLQKSFKTSTYPNTVLVFGTPQFNAEIFVQCMTADQYDFDQNCTYAKLTEEKAETSVDEQIVPKLYKDRKGETAYYSIQKFFSFENVSEKLTSFLFINRILRQASSFKFVFLISKNVVKSNLLWQDLFQYMRHNLNQLAKYLGSVLFFIESSNAFKMMSGSLLRNNQYRMTNFNFRDEVEGFSAYFPFQIEGNDYFPQSVQSSFELKNISETKLTFFKFDSNICFIKISDYKTRDEIIQMERNSYQQLISAYHLVRENSAKILVSHFENFRDMNKAKIVSKNIYDILRNARHDICTISPKILSMLTNFDIFLDRILIQKFSKVCEKYMIFNCVTRNFQNNFFIAFLIDFMNDRLSQYSHWENEYTKLSSYNVQRTLNSDLGRDKLRTFYSRLQSKSTPAPQWKYMMDFFFNNNIAVEDTGASLIAKGNYLFLHNVMNKAKDDGKVNIALLASETIFIDRDIDLPSTSQNYNIFIAARCLHVEKNMTMHTSGSVKLLETNENTTSHSISDTAQENLENSNNIYIIVEKLCGEGNIIFTNWRDSLPTSNMRKRRSKDESFLVRKGEFWQSSPVLQQFASHSTTFELLLNEIFNKFISKMKKTIFENLVKNNLTMQQDINSYHIWLKREASIDVPMENANFSGYILNDTKEAFENILSVRDTQLQGELLNIVYDAYSLIKNVLGVNKNNISENFLMASMLILGRNKRQTRSQILVVDIYKNINQIKENVAHIEENLIINEDIGISFRKQDIINTYKINFQDSLETEILNLNRLNNDLSNDVSKHLDDLHLQITKLKNELIELEKRKDEDIKLLNEKLAKVRTIEEFKLFLKIFDTVAGLVDPTVGALYQISTTAIEFALDHVPLSVDVEELKHNWQNIGNDFETGLDSISVGQHLLDDDDSEQGDETTERKSYAENKVGEVEKQIDEAKKDLKNINKFKKLLNKQFGPIIAGIKSKILETLNAKNNIVSFADVENLAYKLVQMMQDLEFAFTSVSVGFKIHKGSVNILSKMRNALQAGINTLQRAQEMKYRKRFVEYIGNIANVESDKSIVDNLKVRASLTEANNLIRFGMLHESYTLAMQNLIMWCFPFADFFLGDFLKFQMSLKLQNEAKVLANDVSRSLLLIERRLNEHQQYVIPHIHKYLFKGKFYEGFSSSNPFAVWSYKDYPAEISSFLSGSPTIFKSKVQDHVQYNAVKFNRVNLKIQSKYTEIQTFVRNAIFKFDISLTHLGDSKYKCGNLYYTILSANQTIRYSLESDNGYPLRHNTVYERMRNGTLLLSPYATWQFELINFSGRGKYSELYKYRESISLVLEGEGSYVSDEAPECQRDLSEFYQTYEPGEDF